MLKPLSPEGNTMVSTLYLYHIDGDAASLLPYRASHDRLSRRQVLNDSAASDVTNSGKV